MALAILLPSSSNWRNWRRSISSVTGTLGLLATNTTVFDGLYFSDNLRWIVEYFSPIKKKGISKAVWLSGGVLALIEIIRFIPFSIESGLSYTEIVDKFISEKYKSLNSGGAETFVEYWSFLRKRGVEEKDMYSTNNCP